jgi:hypothetical protein
MILIENFICKLTTSVKQAGPWAPEMVRSFMVWLQFDKDII